MGWELVNQRQGAIDKKEHNGFSFNFPRFASVCTFGFAHHSLYRATNFEEATGVQGQTLNPQ